MIGQPDPHVTLETVEGFAAYSGTNYSKDRLAELLPSLQALMAEIGGLWDVDVSNSEMAVGLPVEGPED